MKAQASRGLANEATKPESNTQWRMAGRRSRNSDTVHAAPEINATAATTMTANSTVP
jgi:hypothetical protein